MRSTEILSVRVKRSMVVDLRVAASRKRLSRNAFCAQALNKAVLETLKEGDSRARAIVEFVEGDFTQPPIIYPLSGTDAEDEVVCREILKRWKCRV